MGNHPTNDPTNPLHRLAFDVEKRRLPFEITADVSYALDLIESLQSQRSGNPGQLPSGQAATELSKKVGELPADDERLRWAVYTAAYAVLRDYENHPTKDRGLISAGDQRIPNLIADSVVNRVAALTADASPSPARTETTAPVDREAVAHEIYDWLDERFPGGAMPGGVQLFADPGDAVDAGMKHEAGCLALADRILALLPHEAEGSK